MFLVFLILTLFARANTQDNGLGKFIIVSDLLPEQCFANGQNYVPEDLPHCENFTTRNEICNSLFTPTYRDLQSRPTCNKDGKFGPKQCKGEPATGRCFCFDEEGGRLFGQQWWTQADNMTCACSRSKADMAGSVYFNSLHCNSVGNYEPLQCDVISGQCWCADERTGNLASPVVPQAAMTKLPCYNSLTVGTQYLRLCENKKYAQKTIAYQLQLRGSMVSFGDFLCDDDGSYGAYSLIDGIAYCTWRDNSKVGTWASSEKISAMDCNCAKDSRIFSEAGKSQLQSCSGNGNYMEFQEQGSSTYCVDKDGYRKSVDDTVESADKCAQYHAYH